MSKHDLLRHWLIPKLVRNVASFVGFLQFYSNFIPHFEVRSLPLCKIMSRKYKEPVGNMWTPKANSSFKKLKQSVLCNPCLSWFDHCKFTVLRTNISALGFGYNLCQPGDIKVSLSMTAEYMLRNGFGFMTKSGGGILHPDAFGSCRTCGNETQLHYYLGKGFAGDWAINKNLPHVFWMPIHLGDRLLCCQIHPIVQWFKSCNPLPSDAPGVLDMDIVHHANDFLVDADYWSCLNVDLCYNPTFCKYLWLVSLFCSMHPPPADLPMQPKNMPYYWGLCFSSTTTQTSVSDPTANSLLTMIVTQELDSASGSSKVHFEQNLSDSPILTNNTIQPLHNLEFPVFAYCASCFTWAVYLFNSGHFASTILRRNLPFKILLACNPYAYGCVLFAEFTKCPCVLPSAAALLDHIRGSRDNGLIDGYLVHLHHYQTSEPPSTFVNLQVSIVIQLHYIWKLRLFVAFVHPDHKNHCVSEFISQLSAKGWVVSQTKCSFPTMVILCLA
jgi:hypothetical protein